MYLGFTVVVATGIAFLLSRNKNKRRVVEHPAWELGPSTRKPTPASDVAEARNNNDVGDTASARIAAARSHSLGGLSYADLKSVAQNLDGKHWQDPDFKHTDASLFEDPEVYLCTRARG